jgi:hypothetical protein
MGTIDKITCAELFVDMLYIYGDSTQIILSIFYISTWILNLYLQLNVIDL